MQGSRGWWVWTVLAWARVVAGTYELQWLESLGLVVKGPPLGTARVEWASDIDGTWTALTEVALGPEGRATMEVAAVAGHRFFRATAGGRPAGPMGFAWIPPGMFWMGSPADEPGRQPDEVQRMVVLSRGFWLSDHEVTQAEYESVMGVNPARFKGDARRPVETVSWYEAIDYCQRRTERERADGTLPEGLAYRLPTEAEWEYAARAGTTGARHGELDAIAWHGGNSGGQTHPVMQKAPNAWGLHDMIGNVWEWCADWHADYPEGMATDPEGPPTGFSRVFRGGGWGSGTSACRSADRNWGMVPGSWYSFLGFRPALSEE